MLNRVILMGRLVRDPELRRTGSGISVASFTMAVDRNRKNQDGAIETDFLDCVAWRSTAEFISRNFTKGRLVAVEGQIQNRQFTDKEGDKRKATEIHVDNAYFADSKKETTANFPMIDYTDESDCPF